MKFAELNLSEAILKAVAAEGYETATPIQAAAIPHILAKRDIMGCAQTGTGKTAAFALPTLHRLGSSHPSGGHSNTGRGRKIRCLVLSPTRELTCQIGDSFRAYGRNTGLRHTIVYGGVGQNPQVKALQAGVDTVIATPGRLLDLMNQGYIDLSRVEVLILDEADQMLDMGFIHDLKKIVAKVPRDRQTLMFSATMAPEIRQLASAWLRDPVNVQVSPVATPIEKIQQSVYLVDKRNKPHLLSHFLLESFRARTLVFTRTKHGADLVVKHLTRLGIKAEAIHGNKSQAARQRALAQFKSQNPPVLVATDIAARGLDIDQISHVINYDLPIVPDLYVHRIGRTARAGAEGVAVSFCDRDERGHLQAIERLTRQRIRIEASQPEYPKPSPEEAARQPARREYSPAAPSNGSRRPNDRFRKPAANNKPKTKSFGLKRFEVARGEGAPAGEGQAGGGNQRGSFAKKFKTRKPRVGARG
jgi:ATP-dependent RNA helicase RhlE